VAVEGKIEIRVRYNETDGQGRVHHAQYLNYFERGRVELLRDLGHSYKDFEATGLMLVVAEMNVRYLNAAEFDDLLTLSTRVNKVRRVRIFHDYTLTGTGGTPIVEASSTIACVDRSGKLQALPEYLRAS
jgi:acyl-CoA thioester hydrolase